ncbi:MAG: hypothetical protein H0U49_01750 [Parachlamydiaceae bacterium]|nr:hypothetical protein [Parachlamydiaceae bacterium]
MKKSEIDPMVFEVKSLENSINEGRLSFLDGTLFSLATMSVEDHLKRREIKLADQTVLKVQF